MKKPTQKTSSYFQAGVCGSASETGRSSAILIGCGISESYTSSSSAVNDHGMSLFNQWRPAGNFVICISNGSKSDIYILQHMRHTLLVGLVLVAMTAPIMAVSPSGKFQQLLPPLQRQGRCEDLPIFGVNTHRRRNPDDVNIRLISQVGARMVRLESLGLI